MAPVMARNVSLLAVTLVAGASLALYLSSSTVPTPESCRATMAKLFNAPALLNVPTKQVRVVYVFDVEKGDKRELRHILAPPLGSLESYHSYSDEKQHILTYATGRVGDLAGAANEIHTMCLRERDDGFHLRTVRIMGDDVDVRYGSDPAEMPVGKSLQFIVSGPH